MSIGINHYSLCITALSLMTAVVCGAQPDPVPAKILYLTTSAGYRHDVLPVTVEVLRSLCARSRRCEITHTEDTGQINAVNLQHYKAVVFYTSGELPLSAAQKQALLDFVATGGAFAGFHSATDTLYTWPEYGALIGAYFDGHPWTQQARVLVEQPEHPIAAAIPSPWTLPEEYYQFRNFSRERTTVLLSLDKSSVDVAAPGVNTSDFPLAWTRAHLGGRVFYTALGHLEETWRDPVFQRLIDNALIWLLADAPRLVAGGTGNAATLSPAGIVSAGSLITIYGSGLTADGRSGSTPTPDYPDDVAGTRVLLDGRALPLLYVGPNQINAFVPPDITAGPCTAMIGSPCLTPRVAVLEVRTPVASASQRVFFADLTPGIFAVTAQRGAVTVWATGLGAVRLGHDGLRRSERLMQARIGGLLAQVQYAGWSQYPGLFQINVLVPPELPPGTVQTVEVTVDGYATPLSREFALQ